VWARVRRSYARASDRFFATMGTGPAGLLGTLLRTNS